MLKQVLEELDSAKSAVNLNELSDKLGIERSALDAMIAYLVKKGKLRDDERDQIVAMGSCHSGSCNCGGSCHGSQGCPFVTRMPRTFSLPSPDDTVDDD